MSTRRFHESTRTLGAALIAVALGSAVATLAAVPAGASTYGGPGRIAYVGYDGPKTHYHIWTMAFDGTDKVDITPANTDVVNDPAWSPDGQSIAFTRGPGGSAMDIWRMDADGGNPVQLTTDPSREIRPSWSPDGSTIVFESGGKLATISAVDGSQRTVVGRGDAPVFSPNGKKIVFARYHEGDSDIFVMDADGTRVMNLTRTAGISEFLPDWAPDGHSIIFQRSHGDHDLFTMRPDGSKQYLITRDDMFDGYPSFSPDGTWILTARDTGLTRMNASGTQAATLVDIQDLAEYSSDWQPLPCTISGTDGPDELIGTTGNDVICGDGGADIIDALEGDDVVLGGAGGDSVYGRDGKDILAGAGGADVLRGEAGADRITGDAAPDTHNGGTGDDYLFAWDRGSGDRLLCGLGHDRYAYEKGDTVRCPT